MGNGAWAALSAALAILAGLALYVWDWRAEEPEQRPSPRPTRRAPDGWWREAREASTPLAADGHEQLDMPPHKRQAEVADLEALLFASNEGSDR